MVAMDNLKNMRKIELLISEDKLATVINILKGNLASDEIITTEVLVNTGESVSIEYRGHKVIKHMDEKLIKVDALLKDNKVDKVVDKLKKRLFLKNYEYIIIYDVDKSKGNDIRISDSINVSREELLKKLGISDPDEELINSILNSAFGDEDTFIEIDIGSVEKDIENRIDIILNVLKNQDLIEDYTIKTKIDVKNKKYVCLINIVLIQKKIFGMISKSLNVDSIKKDILNSLDEIPYDIKYDICIKTY